MNIGEYLRETKMEIKHVNWPTRRQSIVFTIIVIAISIFVGAFLGFFDYIFGYALKFFI